MANTSKNLVGEFFLQNDSDLLLEKHEPIFDRCKESNSPHLQTRLPPLNNYVI